LKVIILCGGKGNRLKPLTEKIPKPLIKINKKPILFYIVSYFIKYGINDFIFCTGYKSSLIEKYVEKSFKNINYDFINSGDVDIIKRVFDVRESIKDQFILCYGDTIADVDLIKLFNFHNSHLGFATITTYQLISQFGIVMNDNLNLVTSFGEKPKLDNWINIGYFFMDYEVFELIPQYSTFIEFINGLIQLKYLYSYRHDGLHITVNTFTELEIANGQIETYKEKLRK
tara:strand:+ start:44 stop:730 length:687 start_codon:yes stop_codon:yes gene_type:complete